MPRVDCGGATAALVFLNDPEQEVGSVEARARTLYGLTKAEGRVAALLIKGCPVERVAEELETSVHTVRTQVKRVLEKTATNRQGDLLRLLGQWSAVESGNPPQGGAAL